MLSTVSFLLSQVKCYTGEVTCTAPHPRAGGDGSTHEVGHFLTWSWSGRVSSWEGAVVHRAPLALTTFFWICHKHNTSATRLPFSPGVATAESRWRREALRTLAGVCVCASDVLSVDTGTII